MVVPDPAVEAVLELLAAEEAAVAPEPAPPPTTAVEVAVLCDPAVPVPETVSINVDVTPFEFVPSVELDAAAMVET